MWSRLFGRHRDEAVGSGNKAARERWLRQVLAALPAGARILDAGAGEQQYRPLCAHLDYVAQDFAGYDGQGDARGLQRGHFDASGVDIQCDITAIPEPDGSFDAVMCIEVLEHLPRPLDALRELSRLLRPGGSLVLTAPFCSLTHFAPYHFVSGFNRYFYETHLPPLGLRIRRIEPNGNFFEYLAQEARRVGSVADAHAGRPLSARDRGAVDAFLALLGELSRADRGSHELLCFGYHVLADKTAEPDA